MGGYAGTEQVLWQLAIPWKHESAREKMNDAGSAQRVSRNHDRENEGETSVSKAQPLNSGM